MEVVIVRLMVEKTCLIVTFLGMTCAVPVCRLAKLLLAPLEEPLFPAPLEEPLFPAPLAELPPAAALLSPISLPSRFSQPCRSDPAIEAADR